tara:strand:- start:1706 stop:2056 length:351 start_codon:yes stop_codon:yes gene_type:complete
MRDANNKRSLKALRLKVAKDNTAKGTAKKAKAKQTVPSRASLISLAKKVVTEVSGMKETRPNQNYGREVKLMSRKLKDLGFTHTMTDGKTGTNRVTLASTLLQSVKGSETAKLLKK